MPIEITTAENEREYEAYRALRDTPRNIMAHGVYPNIVKMLSAYQVLSDALAGDMSGYAEYHDGITAAVAPHIASIQEWSQNIIDTVQAIETAAPGTFGIPMPAEEPADDE